MKTLKHIASTFRFLRTENAKNNTKNTADIELTNKKFGFNIKRTPAEGKATVSLLSLLYAEENETLFI